MTSGHLHKLYLSEFVPRALYSFGRLGTHPAIIPGNLFPPPSEDRRIGGVRGSGTKIKFLSAELHLQWRRQAEVRRFGPDVLERVLGDARSLARIQGPGFHGHYPPWRVEQLAQRLWSALTQPAAKKPEQTQQPEPPRPSVITVLRKWP